MKQIVVISGKGGTGKTLLTASFASLARSKVMVDCDVDAADLHLILHPSVKEQHEFRSGHTAVINKSFCKECGKCIDLCRFNAIDDTYTVDPVSCEGCRLCEYVCPVNAVRMEENISGDWFISDTKYGPMVHAKLGIAEENSGKLVALVRKKAKEIADKGNHEYIIIDGPPGIGCPVIASLSGVDVALVVTEPTLSGIHDMMRVLEVASHFDTEAKVVINKYDLNEKNSQDIKAMCSEKGVEIIGMVPFSKEACYSIVNALPLVEYTKGPITQEIISIWNKLE
ncbi:MAG: ATP-binding protein [Candidatus Ancaeobacter aquaticus]|nr:ATP-binding protein [Candidatus Ancaeobacter aquaticus]